MENVFHDYYFRIQPEIIISDLAALKQSEDEPAQDFITRFRKLKLKCRIPMEERHFIQMAQAALKISLRKRFDGMLFGDLAELVDKASKYEELLKEEQQKRNSSKGTYYKSPSSSVHLVEVDALFVEMLLQKAIETPHRFPKPEELKGRQYCRWHNSWNHSTNSCVVFRDVIQEGITTRKLKLAEKPPSVTTDPFPQPQVNMVNLNWPEQKGGKPATEADDKCKCETELEAILDKQNQPTPSVFDRIGTSCHPSRDRARQKDYLRPAQGSRRMTEQPKKETPIKMPRSEKPLATIIEGRWYSVGKKDWTEEYEEQQLDYEPSADD
ncbi:unnamed protein product [Prunus brigantina]